MAVEVHEKWGFGMAPPFPKVTNERRLAARKILDTLNAVVLPDSDQQTLEALSIIKGLFTRAWKADQWDWFTVLGQLGYPSDRISEAIAESIAECRIAIRDGDEIAYWNSRSKLMRLPFRRCLDVFIGRSTIQIEIGSGWIYILSTREMPQLLKIGMTTRTVQERAREINGSTGVAIPFGVRRCWLVSDPILAEREVHAALFDKRVRGDREFFRIEFRDASKIIINVLRDRGLLLRTLENLGALAPA